MKRGWIGAALLLVLLAGGIWSVMLLTRQHSPMERQMEQAAAYALAMDWEKAEALTGSVRAAWENAWHSTAAFADHDPMEAIDGLFAQLEVYAEVEEAPSYAAVCAELSRQLAAMGEAHVPNWWNLL